MKQIEFNCIDTNYSGRWPHDVNIQYSSWRIQYGPSFFTDHFSEHNLNPRLIGIPKLYNTKGKAYALSFQVAGVSKALGAVSRIVGAGNRVIFDDPETVGSYIENKKSGKRHPLIRNSINGLWYLNAYHLPKEIIATLEVGVFSGQASEYSSVTRQGRRKGACKTEQQANEK